ncbi:MAG: hypothetical protein AAB250_07350 [Bdellovibrionota bacterium]
MKTSFGFFAALFFSTFAFAQTRTDATPATMAALPAAIKCTSNAISNTVKSFEISSLDTIELESTIDDASFMDTPDLTTNANGKQNISFTFSNECDNGYGFTFSVDDLVQLKAGSLQAISGTLEYGDVDLYDETNGQITEETVTVSCGL